MSHVEEAKQEHRLTRKREQLTPQERRALHLIETTNIPKTRISREQGIKYPRLLRLQALFGIERPEQVFGLPKREISHMHRKKRTP